MARIEARRLLVRFCAVSSGVTIILTKMVTERQKFGIADDEFEQENSRDDDDEEEDVIEEEVAQPVGERRHARHELNMFESVQAFHVNRQHEVRSQVDGEEHERDEERYHKQYCLQYSIMKLNIGAFHLGGRQIISSV